MRTIMMMAVTALTVGLMPGVSAAARQHEAGVHARDCTPGRADCRRVARQSTRKGRRAVARVEAVVPDVVSIGDANGMLPGQIYPSRPYGAAPGSCFTDDGGGRFRSCDAGDTQ